jgi:NitT/TauT family transport system substrate-binding protein
MKINRKITGALALILSLIVAFGLTACGNKTEDTSDTGNTSATEYKYGKIQIPGKDGALCGAPIYIAYENGFFAEEGFDVELISADTETRKIGLNNGTIPIVNGDFQFFPSIEEGIDVKVVDGLHKGCIKLVVNPDSDIKTAADLKGKKIGVDEIGGTPHQVASVWVEQAGISALPEKNEVTFLPFSDGNLELEALRKGDIDVAAMWDPLASVAEKAGTVKTILDIGTDAPFAGKYCCFLYASSKLIDENPEEIAAILRAYRKAQDWISANAEEAVEIIIKGNYSEIEDKELAAELISHYEYPSASAHTQADADDTVKENVQYFAQQLYNIGYLKTEPAQFAQDAFYQVDLNLGK